MNYLKNELYELLKKESYIFDFIQNYALDGLWFWDLENPENEWMNPKFWITLGYDPSQMSHSPSAWQDIIFKDDLKDAQHNVELHLKDANHPYNQIVRYKHKNGSTVWIRCYGVAIRNAEGKPTRMLGAHIDVTKLKETEARLLDKVERFDHIINGSNLGTWQWNVQTGECVFNERWAEIVGYSLEELEPISIDTWLKLAHPVDLEISSQKLTDHFEGKSAFYRLEARMLHKKGHWVWVLDKGKVVSWTEDGKPEWVTGSHQDITDRKQMEEALKKSNQRNKTFVEQAPTAIAMFDTNMVYLAASNQWIEDYGLQEIEIIGKSHYEIFPEISAEWKAHHQEALKGAILNSEEEQFTRDNGDKIWIQWEIKPWFNEHDNIGGILMFTADITATKQREALLMEYQDLLKRVKEVALIGTWEFSIETQKIIWSNVTKRIHDVDQDYTPSLETAIDFFPEGENRKKIQIALETAISTGNGYDLELQIRTAKGNLKWVRAIGISDFRNGKCTRIYGLFQDIDQQTKNIKKLAFEEEQFRQTFEFASIGMAIVGLSGQWLRVNSRICEILGYTKEELYKIDFQQLTYEKDLNIDLELLNDVIAGKINNYSIEKRYLHKTGKIIWAKLAVSMVRNDEGIPIHFVSQIQDITKSKQAQLQLEATINRLQGILDASTQVGIIETNKEGVILSYNKGAINLLGFQPDEVINTFQLSDFHQLSELEEHSSSIEKEGITNISPAKDLFSVAQTLGFETKEWNYNKKDGSVLPVQLTITAIKNVKKQITGYLAIVADISNMKAAENEIKSLLKVTQDQNKRLLNFAHIVSHNLRSHTSNLSMLLNLSSLPSKISDSNKIFSFLEKASNNLSATVEHLNEIVVINTNTSENLVYKPVKPFVTDALATFKGEILKQDAKVTINIEESLAVMCLPAYLESSLLNLISNALKYRSEKNKPEILIKAEKYEHWVLISVKDNGIGIDLSKHGAKIFGMYKTFHSNKDARGIGLFITKNQIEAMGGKIDVESELNKGTTFKIWLKHDEI